MIRSPEFIGLCKVWVELVICYLSQLSDCFRMVRRRERERGAGAYDTSIQEMNELNVGHMYEDLSSLLNSL